ncbi:MAG TPA: YcgL domain-containing protein [Ectothiorhodospiraceae bacterium]|nr:YcgL domain-containing protein [Ectothiorhodospiraceae bacterium]
MGEENIHTTIYRSKHRPGLYLFLAEADKFEVIPQEIMRSLGELELSMELDLHEERTLALSDVKSVMQNLKEYGFHIQLPPQDFDLEQQLKSIIN